MTHVPRVSKPRCFLVYALAPEGLTAAEANQRLNSYAADPTRGLAVFHDHFIGKPGGVAVIFAETPEQREALTYPGPLQGWQLSIHPLVFSHSPAALDEQISYTLRAYRAADWEALQKEDRPHYGNSAWEAENAMEDDGAPKE